MRVKFLKNHAKKFKEGMVVDDIQDSDVKMLEDRGIVTIVDDKTPVSKKTEHPVKAAPLPHKIETKADEKANVKNEADHKANIKT